MFWNLGRLAARGYILLLTVAAGGFLGANIAGFVPAVIEHVFHADGRPPPPETYLRWMHGGWLAGALVFLAGGLLELWRRRSAKRRASKPRPSRRRTARHGNDDEEQRPTYPEEQPRRYGSPRRVLGSAGFGGLVGGFLGMMLGGSFLLLWFSLSYSPFSPAEWGGSVAVERAGPSRTKARVHTTEHPIAMYAFLGPVVLGATGGALLFGIGGLIGKVTVTAGKTDR